jgi:hypothetical protein
MSPEISSILEDLALAGQRIQVGVYDFAPDEKDPQYEMHIRREILEHLGRFSLLWKDCDIFVVEQQYFNTFSNNKKKRGTEANVKAIKVAETVLSWFTMMYPDRKIKSFGAQFKTQILGAPPDLTKSQRKRWCDNKAKEILKTRGDTEALQVFKKARKSSDMSDALTMCQAYIYRYFVAEF